MKKFKKAISLITALAMVLGFSFTAMPNKVYAASKVSIQFNASSNVGEVEITLSNGTDEGTIILSNGGTGVIQVDKITSGNYTITAEQKELYKPPYDLVLQPKAGDEPYMIPVYSNANGSEVNGEGIEASVTINTSYLDEYTMLEENSNYGNKKVSIQVPSKDMNIISEQKRSVNIDADHKLRS